MKKRWMFIIAELAAMIIIEVIRKLQYRKDRLSRSPEWVREKNRKEYEESRPDPRQYHASYKFEPPPLSSKERK